VSGVLYIPFIHSRHNAKDRSLGVGRDIKLGSLLRLTVMQIIKILTLKSATKTIERKPEQQAGDALFIATCC